MDPTCTTSDSMARGLLDVPEDVLAQIFSLACHPTRGAARWPRSFYPLWLGQICRACRECAWVSSELWTTIVLRISLKRIEAQTELLSEWLERAKGRPLDIYVEEPRSNARSYDADAEVGFIPKSRFALQILARHSGQWRRVEFHLPARRYGFIELPSKCPVQEGGSVGRYPYASFPPMPLSFPLLQYVSLHHAEAESRGQTLALNLSQADALRTLSLSSLTMRTVTFTNYPTKRITHLIFNHVSQINLRNLLVQFFNLRKLTLNNCHVLAGIANINPAHALPPKVHENLQSLSLEFGPEFRAPDALIFELFDQITLPALKSLHIRVPRKIPFARNLLPFIERSACALTQLTLAYYVAPELDLIEFLSSPCLSSLAELRIRHFGNFRPILEPSVSRRGLTGLFFDQLHPLKYPEYLPHLKILEFQGRLSAESIDFIEPLVIRSHIRESESSCIITPTKTAILRKVTIVPGLNSSVAKLKIDEHMDQESLQEFIRMVDMGVLTFVNDGAALCQN
ncbi:hypothetical protein GALMADRAFT_252342 [Galerina marginata CBS 339.88]|uniref:F-box domain-containing protein n=1 Tax=Galerina marginata (strain CBS 339.88) TaxID=685588 RepID=A0A067T1W1_GALM3|nr:hypothetical protein GALMADRAFT_252342 [Galerina marginata CBS 339.88]